MVYKGITSTNTFTQKACIGFIINLRLSRAMLHFKKSLIESLDRRKCWAAVGCVGECRGSHYKKLKCEVRR